MYSDFNLLKIEVIRLKLLSLAEVSDLQLGHSLVLVDVVRYFSARNICIFFFMIVLRPDRLAI
jgi:hypothetical protein